MTTLLDHALNYYGRGLAAVPIGNGTKAPIVKEWETNRLPAEDLRYYFSNGHNVTGIGIITGYLSGNLAILDFDGQNWQAAFEHFLHAWDELTNSPMVQTGSGKRHLWLKIPNLPTEYTNQKFHREVIGHDKKGQPIYAQTIELRGNASNNLAPPSLHPSGGYYQWLSDEAELLEVDFHALYIWLKEWDQSEIRQAQQEAPMNSNGKYATLPRRTLEFVAFGAEEGNRNDELYEAAKQYFASGRPVEIALEDLIPVALRIGLERKDAEATVRSGYKAADKKGFKAIQQSMRDIQVLQRLGYTFRLNECSDTLEVNGKPMSDALQDKIRSQLRDLGYGGKGKSLKAVEENYHAHAYDHRYHPVKEFLTGLKWDGKYHFLALAEYVQDTDNIFLTWLQRWMIGAIAKVMEQGQNKMLVLDGRQGLGKDYFIYWLASPLPEYHIEAAVNPGEKDNQIRLMSKFVWQVSELGATTRRADREELKDFITKRTVTARKPYDQYDTIKPAMASLVGTINNEAGYLNDPTGNRRFLTCELTRLDWGYAQAIDPLDLWAEAYHLYKEGVSWELTKEEALKQQEINTRYRIDSIVGEMFLRYYTRDASQERVIPTSEIIKFLEGRGLKGNQKASQMELGGYLKELGITKDTNARPVGYKGIRLKEPKEIEEN